MSAASRINRRNDHCDIYLFCKRYIKEVCRIHITVSTFFRLLFLAIIFPQCNDFSIWCHNVSIWSHLNWLYFAFLQTLCKFSVRCTLCPAAMTSCLHRHAVLLFSTLSSLSVGGLKMLNFSGWQSSFSQARVETYGPADELYSIRHVKTPSTTWKFPASRCVIVSEQR